MDTPKEAMEAVEAVEVLVHLVPGYVAFRIFKVDEDWRRVRQSDVVYGSLVFSLLSYAAFLAFRGWLPGGTMLAVIGWALVIAVVIAVIAKMAVKPALYWLLYKLGVTDEDSQGSAFDKIFNDPKIHVRQITAYLKSGEAVTCDDTLEYSQTEGASRRIHSYYTDRDGNLNIIPSRKRIARDAKWEAVEDVTSDWGVRTFHIPADQIERIDVRLSDGHPLMSRIRGFFTGIWRRWWS